MIRAGEKALTRTPAMSSADNRQMETRDVFLAEYGPARVVETTETHGTIEGEFRSWYAGADNKARLDDLTSYVRSAYRAKSLVNYEHTREHGFLEALFHEPRDEGRAGGIHRPAVLGRRHQGVQHHHAAAVVFR